MPRPLRRASAFPDGLIVEVVARAAGAARRRAPIGYDMGMADRPRSRHARLLVVTRWVLPAVIAVAGLILAAVGDSDTAAGIGTGLVGVAVILVLISLFMQLSAHSNKDREREESARAFFDRHGRWPGQGEH